jgi:hypothetical protein
MPADAPALAPIANSLLPLQKIRICPDHVGDGLERCVGSAIGLRCLLAVATAGTTYDPRNWCRSPTRLADRQRAAVGDGVALAGAFPDYIPDRPYCTDDPHLGMIIR